MAAESIRERIRKLRQMTEANGCTEAEALSAAAKAAEMMREHGLSDAEIEMDFDGRPAASKGKSCRQKLWTTAAWCTNSAVIVIPDAGGRTKICFIGETPGPEIAHYLSEVCNRAVNREVRAFKASSAYRRRRTLSTKRHAVADFTNAMVNRLCYRMADLFQAARDQSAEDRAKAALESAYPRTAPIKRPAHSSRFRDAATAGWLAGEKPTLAHGLDRSEQMAAITGRQS